MVAGYHSYPTGPLTNAGVPLHIATSNSRERLVVKPGVTQELRSRVDANVAAEARRRQLVVGAVVVAVVAVCAYVLLRWLA